MPIPLATAYKTEWLKYIREASLTDDELIKLMQKEKGLRRDTAEKWLREARL